eukprot:m.360683 g.360683  ORF g.360683 m.360683 type:complete len:63 (+) comp19145_c0_seq1:2921-3109(+)
MRTRRPQSAGTFEDAMMISPAAHHTIESDGQQLYDSLAQFLNAWCSCAFSRLLQCRGCKHLL